jgi:hypothetical protein
VNTKELKIGQHQDQHSGNVALLAWQEKKQLTMISAYHKQDVCGHKKASQEESKSMVVCDCKVSMRGVHLEDTLQLELLK